jgi:hypothetical protein
MKPVVIIYLSRLFYQMGNDSVQEMTQSLQSPDDQYHLFVIPSSGDNTTIDVFPKYVLVDKEEDFAKFVEAQNLLAEQISRISNVMEGFLKEHEE